MRHNKFVYQMSKWQIDHSNTWAVAQDIMKQEVWVTVNNKQLTHTIF